MKKRVYESELRDLLRDCFLEAYSVNEWFKGSDMEIKINTIYAKILYKFPNPSSLRNAGFDTFENLLKEYCGNNLNAIMKDDGIIIQVEYEIIPTE